MPNRSFLGQSCYVSKTHQSSCAPSAAGETESRGFHCRKNNNMNWYAVKDKSSPKKHLNISILAKALAKSNISSESQTSKELVNCYDFRLPLNMELQSYEGICKKKCLHFHASYFSKIIDKLMVNSSLGDYLKAGSFVFTIRSKKATHNKTFIFSLDAFMMSPLGYSYIRVINCCVQKHTW